MVLDGTVDKTYQRGSLANFPKIKIMSQYIKTWYILGSWSILESIEQYFFSEVLFSTIHNGIGFQNI